MEAIGAALVGAVLAVVILLFMAGKAPVIEDNNPSVVVKSIK